jgi:triosephosphate isomerase (TIM)
VRRFLIAGNWKMNLDQKGSDSLARSLAELYPVNCGVDIAVFPPAVYLQSVSGVLNGSAVGWGAQNMYFKDNGAFTGEISASMLVDLGCRYVILGHSERRTLMNELDLEVNAKAHAALAAGLTPIVCLGETLEQRESGKTREVIQKQFVGSLAGIPAESIARVVIAYEPVWAIGTGKVASGDQAQEVHADLRKMLESRYNSQSAEKVRILYGGSVKADNAADLLGRIDIDGALVGGASLNADSFAGIVAAAIELA